MPEALASRGQRLECQVGLLPASFLLSWAGLGVEGLRSGVAASGEVRMRSTHQTHCLATAEFSIWTREAGAGGLAIAVEGPSKAEISFEDRKDGSCGVAYVVQEPGTEGRAGVRGGGVGVVGRSMQTVLLGPLSTLTQGHRAVRGRREARTRPSGGPHDLRLSLRR